MMMTLEEICDRGRNKTKKIALIETDPTISAGCVEFFFYFLF